MKKFAVLLISISLSGIFSSVNAQHQDGQINISGNDPAKPAPTENTESKGGIEFFHGSIEELKAEAKAKKKLIFMDAFTEWCGPCKMMSSGTFTDTEVGKFFNANFINYKLDMEKGEGPGMAVRYEITAYPTLLFLNAKGEVVHRVMGFRQPGQFLEEGRKAINPKDNLALMKSEYDSGSKDPALLLNYAKRLAESEQEYGEVAQKYFETQAEKDLISPENWEAIKLLTDSLNSREFQFLLKKKADFVKKYPQKEIDTKIYAVCSKIAEAAMKSGNAAKYQGALDIARKYIGDNGKAADEIEIKNAKYTSNWEVYAEKVIAYVSKHKPANAGYLNGIAWDFYEHVSNPEQLTKALAWAKQSVALENAYYNNDTVAALLFKLKKYSEALKYANKAVHIAQENGEESEATQNLIQKIEAEMESK